jgi:hypothetical protein
LGKFSLALGKPSKRLGKFSVTLGKPAPQIGYPLLRIG